MTLKHTRDVVARKRNGQNKSKDLTSAVRPPSTQHIQHTLMLMEEMWKRSRRERTDETHATVRARTHFSYIPMEHIYTDSYTQDVTQENS